MKITAALKEHLKRFGLADSASDDDVARLVGEKLASGDLTVPEYRTLTKSVDDVRNVLDQAIDQRLSSIGITTAPDAPVTLDLMTRSLYGGGGEITTSGAPAVGTKGANPAHTVMMGGVGTGNGAPRVKSIAEQYDRSTKAYTYDQSTNQWLKSVWAGQPVMSTQKGEGAHAINHPSQLDLAVCGAWFKLAAHSAARGYGGAPLGLKLTEHDHQLINYAIHEMAFTGSVGSVAGSDDGRFSFINRKLHDYERKSLLDDVLSGGLEAAPIVFDDAIIVTPLLNGEIFPLVNLVTITRGRRIEAFSIGNPTFQWGISEGTNIPLFTTDGFIAAFDNTIHNATGAMTIGLDFEEDSPTNVGSVVIQRYGQAALETLDRVCAVGNGTTEPLGALNSPGIAAILSENGTGGPPTLGDYSALQFGLAKEFRNSRAVYVSNDVSYQRSRNLKVDPATPSTDERRLMGMDFQSYNTLGYRHKINHSISNSKVGFFDFGRFRMYRRAGLSIQIERAGQSLVLSNQQLIVCRMRFGGSLEHPGAGALMEDAQA
jgi:HK97 family phage major capsid protein